MISKSIFDQKVTTGAILLKDELRTDEILQRMILSHQ